MILDLAPHGSLKKMFPIHKISLLSISTISLHTWQTTGNGYLLLIDQDVLIVHLTTAIDKYLSNNKNIWLLFTIYIIAMSYHKVQLEIRFLLPNCDVYTHVLAF